MQSMQTLSWEKVCVKKPILVFNILAAKPKSKVVCDIQSFTKSTNGYIWPKPLYSILVLNFSKLNLFVLNFCSFKYYMAPIK